ncbi:MAG: aldo/keto reductase [Planctomycetaceae bacterium]
MRTISLVNGHEMPSVGLGMWKVDPADVPELIEHAVERGYRHFDNACDYGNEAQVGEGLRRVLGSGRCRREDLWITSKLWNTYHAPEHVRPAVEKSLRDLQLGYLDLYLIHFPISQKYVPIDHRYPPGWLYDPAAATPRMEFSPVPIVETWRAMEELVDQGLVRQIGISNFGTSLIRDLLASARIRPAVLQVEMHPYLTQEKLLRYCKQEEIAVTAFSPLGAMSYFSLGMAANLGIGSGSSGCARRPFIMGRHRHKSCCVGVATGNRDHPEDKSTPAPHGEPGAVRFRPVRGGNAGHIGPQSESAIQRPGRFLRRGVQHVLPHL